MSIHTIRRNNILSLYTEFVAKAQKEDPSIAVFGLDRKFSAVIMIANTSFSSMKSGARPIGDKTARQIESTCKKPKGWLDEDHQAHAPTNDERELAAFLKLASRIFSRSTPLQRQELIARLSHPPHAGDSD